MFVVLSLATAAAAPSPPLVDLLDFDQGTVLMSASTSSAEGVLAGAPFYLTDGNKKEGWSSRPGEPIGATFVYELDSDAEPVTLRLVNAKGAVAARSVEVWGAPVTGEFEKLGAFEASKGAEQEFPLIAPKHPVRRVKVVLNSNWGDSKTTEVMEVDVLGKKGAAPTVDMSGLYYSPLWKGLRLTQSPGSSYLEGCYDHDDGTFSGDVEGRVARVQWGELLVKGKPHYTGSATFVVGSDGRVRGVYYVKGDLLPRGTWDLERIGEAAEQAPECTPPSSSLAEQLKRQGRLALYGIRFDVGSAVLKPDSMKSLGQVFEMLKREPALRIRVEGHTDATNSDAYNQDLSERRARAVVQWLVDKGVPPNRLQSKGFGRTKPVASNETTQGRGLNRRVEISVLK
jgi:outer membrane protein OmpA-like peptidoglycan-associated protein